MSEFCQNIGRRRRDNQSINRLSNSDMLDGGINVGVLRARAEEIRNHLLAAEGSERKRADKLLGSAGHNDLDSQSAVLEHAHQFGGFICSNAARDTKSYLHTGIVI